MKEHKLYLKLQNGVEMFLLVPFETVRQLVRQGLKIIHEAQQHRPEESHDRLHILENFPDHPQDPLDAQEHDAGLKP